MASVGFRWLDILEKEFDKAFVDLDLAIGELEADEPSVVFLVRQQLCSLSSCFAQLTHKAQTIFQNSAKIEAELIHMRAELTESKSKREALECELHHLLLQLHSSQLAKLPDKRSDGHFKPPDVNAIKKKLDDEIRQSPLPRMNSKDSEDMKINPVSLESAKYKAEIAQLKAENAALRNEVLALNSEVYGAKLAAKYLDKELAGRIQQLQLLGREMRGDVRDKLWRQLESEILLQRHKTVVRACRRNSSMNNKCPKPDFIENPGQFGDSRTVVVKRKPDQGLGISITGGREHGVPILISELEPNGPAALSKQLYIGDAILYVNDIDLRNACHREAVTILQQQSGDCTLRVQYVAADDSDNSLEEDGFNYKFFDEDVYGTSNLNIHRDKEDIVNTPTAPRTPDSLATSRLSGISSPEKKSSNVLEVPHNRHVRGCRFDANSNTNGNVEDTKDTTETKTCLSNNNKSPESSPKGLTTDDLYNIDTNDLILVDNSTNNVIKLENFKKVDMFSNIDGNYNTSTNSLNSENFSSPMQTSTDVYLDSEILSTDLASNDSQSPKNVQTDIIKTNFVYEHVAAEKKDTKEETQNPLYGSNDSLSNPAQSDQSLLNSDASCTSSPLHKPARDYKKQKKHKKKYFGVKTLQSIFSKHEGYSDVSTTASETGEEPVPTQSKRAERPETLAPPPKSPKDASYPEPSPQFEENIHRSVMAVEECARDWEKGDNFSFLWNTPIRGSSLLSDIFFKNFSSAAAGASEQSTGTTACAPMSKTVGSKKYFSLHGQNVRVSKSLRLCPNEDYGETENEQRKEKLLARYVYNANSLNVDGVGDPDFGTPV